MADDFEVRTAHRECIIRDAEARKREGKVETSLEKICVRIPQEEGWKMDAEWLWAEPVSMGVYSLRNIPLYAYGLAMNDHVRAIEREGALEFVEVVKRNGHSNYRIISKADIKNGPSTAIIQKLVLMGCDWEQGNSIHACIDVPPTSNIQAVYKILEEAEKDGVLSFEEGFCGHPV